MSAAEVATGVFSCRTILRAETTLIVICLEARPSQWIRKGDRSEVHIGKSIVINIPGRSDDIAAVAMQIPAVYDFVETGAALELSRSNPAETKLNRLNRTSHTLDCDSAAAVQGSYPCTA